MITQRRSAVRLATIAAIIVLFLFLSSVFEPRKTAYSCRTLWSCLGFGGRHRYTHAAIPDDTEIHVKENVLRDGTLYFEHRIPHADPAILFLVLNKDGASWSSDFRSGQRGIYDFQDLLVSTELNLTNAALAIMTASAEEFETLKAASDRLPFARTSIFYRKDTSTGLSYENRHNHSPEAQLERRSAIATMRNYLMLRALEDELHLVWLDADVVELSPRIIQTMLRHSTDNREAGIITAECHQNQMDNYDKNAWKVNSPDLKGTIGDGDRATAVQSLVDTRLMIPDLIKDTKDSEIIPLDSVGGTLLYIRADLVRQGLTFPHVNVVGTTWNQFGWIGVETEGICYMAKGLEGGGCFVLGGHHHIRHTDWG
ncbi:Hypothetical protein R9X50_00153900 [Acrodontium crateriforme]|uniref:Glycosyltransferase family 62 protein n=1 Tax=Acrodontium crateriforme TaxID=150365 RepID=A0AAQ3R2W3_9PEZI|nr:Hypothetical protein R9X50_00153900 [Acrodontium crateriforme]